MSAQEILGALDPSAMEVAEMLFSLKAGKRPAPDSPSEEDDDPTPPEERSSSSSGSACTSSAAVKPACKALTATSTRSYVWRGPKKCRTVAPSPASIGQAAVLSSDPDEEDECTPGPAPAPAACDVGDAGGSGGERSDRDKEWAALTTWLRMNLHHPRTAKREVLFLGKHEENRGWQFFLNPALAWNDVSPETKMRLRTLPQETELAFMRKYPVKNGRDWVKKTQKYRPPGCAVTYAVPLADMIYSLTAIYYRFEGRPGTGASTAARAAAAEGGNTAANASGNRR